MIVKEGYPFVYIPGGIALGLVLLGFEAAAVFFLIVTGFNVWFFRNPLRTPPADDKAILSPADGKIVSIVRTREDRLLNSEAQRVSVFMSPLNVHVNRSPVSGRVDSVVYNKGKFLTANKEKASLDNEQNALLITAPSGMKFLCVQIAGFIARRIICDVGKGDSLTRGQRFGLIRYGSRVDLFLPLECTVVVREGDRVRGGESIVAYLP